MLRWVFRDNFSYVFIKICCLKNILWKTEENYPGIVIKHPSCEKMKITFCGFVAEHNLIY